MGGPTLRTSLAVLDEHTCEPCRGRHGQTATPPHADCENPDGCRCTTAAASVTPRGAIQLNDQARIIVGDVTITGRVAGILHAPGTIEIMLVASNLETIKVERVTVARITEPAS